MFNAVAVPLGGHFYAVVFEIRYTDTDRYVAGYLILGSFLNSNKSRLGCMKRRGILTGQINVLRKRIKELFLLEWIVKKKNAQTKNLTYEIHGSNY